ncbi:hypothetical protein OIV83_001406 [Microbotryomycetes sp. JL201]|nr:hypothetical protein OIV83_001406 [Microbotryomycetes sp. JL201]
MSVPGRARSTSSTSTNAMSTPVSAGKRRPGVLSPLSSFNASSSSSTPGYAPSTSMSQASLPSLYRNQSTMSASASVAGSLATTTATTQPGPVRFKRGHARRKANANTLASQRTMNPDELDLMALEDPDEVFRMFGVRDVRGLEKRARDAAEAKVSELRTMVGERYRDLLSAADSIVRMKFASEKLVERLERIESAISRSSDATLDTPTKRPEHLKLHSRTLSNAEQPRTLSDPPTLSLTLQLFLSLPSIIDGLLDSSLHLQAARLEGVGRLIYRELSSYGEEDEDGQRVLQAAFPIIERQWKIVGTLRTVITRRASADLSIWDKPVIRTAETLAAIMLLDNVTVPEALEALLHARSKALAAATAVTAEQLDSQNAIQERIRNVLGLLLDTVSTATTVFGSPSDSSTASTGLLVQLLQELQRPTGSTHCESPQLCPILQTVPDYPSLARHLPQDILEYRPHIALDDAKSFRPDQAQADIRDWLQRESTAALDVIRSWIEQLSGGAHALWVVRDSVRFSLGKASTSPYAQSLLRQLEGVIEARLDTVYRSRLAQFVSNVSLRLESLLSELGSSPSDLSTAHHLFEHPLALPQPQHYTSRSSRHGKGPEPFETFLNQVDKRKYGRSPLIDKSLSAFEDEAAELGRDVQEWLEPGDDQARRLRRTFSAAWLESLEGAANALANVLDNVQSNVDQSLFIGNLAHQLALSSVFSRNPLPEIAVSEHDVGDESLDGPRLKLQAIQQGSLSLWRNQTVERCVGKLQETVSTASLSSPATTVWAWEASQLKSAGKLDFELPAQPSSGILSLLRSLVSSLLRVGLHRVSADNSIVNALLAAVERDSLAVASDFVKQLTAFQCEALTKRALATQVAWDITLLRRIWGRERRRVEWDQFESDLTRLADLGSFDSDRLAQSTYNYLQRTQMILYPLVSELKPDETTQTWLLLGAPQSAGINSSEFKSLAGLVKPGPRLGLLPTRT